MQALIADLSETMEHGGNNEHAPLAAMLEPHTSRALWHDLRNIMQAVLGPADTLELALGEGDLELAGSTARRIKKNIELGIELLRHFILLGAADSLKNPEWEIADVVDDVLHLIESSLQEKGIKIHRNIETTARVQLEKKDLFRILLNLLMNAIDAIDKHGAFITIEVKNDSRDWVQLEIHDEGPGIPEEHLLQIFDSGFTTKAERGSSGIGLAFVKDVAEKHCGTIQVFSDAVNGTKFTVCLPSIQNGRGYGCDLLPQPN